MKSSPKPTTFERVCAALAAFLGVAGGAALLSSMFMGFTSLALTLAGVLFIVSSLLVAGNKRLADFITRWLQ